MTVGGHKIDSYNKTQYYVVKKKYISIDNNDE